MKKTYDLMLITRDSKVLPYVFHPRSKDGRGPRPGDIVVLSGVKYEVRAGGVAYEFRDGDVTLAERLRRNP